MQCLHFARRLFDVSPQGLSDQKEALVAECMPNVWWGCGEDDDLRAFLAKVERRMRLRLLQRTAREHCADLPAHAGGQRGPEPVWRGRGPLPGVPGRRSSRPFPTTTTSAVCARSRWGWTRCSTCWTPRPAR